MSVQPYLSKYGINSGDIITKVDGEPVESLRELNFTVFLRGGRTLEVLHPEGKKETVKLPEDVDYKIFENGAFPLFSLRFKTSPVASVFAVKEYADKKTTIKVQDVLYKVNGQQTGEIEDLSQLVASKQTTTLTTIRGKDTLTSEVPANVFEQKILPLYPAFAAGLKPGDKFISVNSTPIEFHDQIQGEIYKSKGKKVAFTVLRGQKEIQLSCSVDQSGMIGFVPEELQMVDEKAIKTAYFGFGASIGKGMEKGMHTLGDYVSQMKFIFTKKGASSIGGFGSMGKLFPPTWDWQVFWLNTALISIILAFMNILPIPALDGGHVVFLLYEIITGKEAPQKVLEYAQYVGFILLLSLLLYANGSDIYRAIFG
jgi:RIP metalloprotease RseP